MVDEAPDEADDDAVVAAAGVDEAVAAAADATEHAAELAEYSASNVAGQAPDCRGCGVAKQVDVQTAAGQTMAGDVRQVYAGKLVVGTAVLLHAACHTDASSVGVARAAAVGWSYCVQTACPQPASSYCPLSEEMGT